MDGGNNEIVMDEYGSRNDLAMDHLTLAPTQGSFSHLASPHHVHLALAQVFPSDFHPNIDGFLKLKAYATKAAQDGADVVAFPEYFLTGAKIPTWHAVRSKGRPEPVPLDRGHTTSGGTSRSQEAAGDDDDDADDGDDESQEKHWIEEISQLARELDINIVAGTVVELGHHVPHANVDGDEKDKKLHNTAYFIGREGEIRGRYTKRYLWHPERDPLTAGNAKTHPSPLLFTFTTKRGSTIKSAMQICWDLAFPESFRNLLHSNPESDQMDGPDLIFVPTCWFATDAGEAGLVWNPSPSGEAALLDSLTLTRALECESILCMINTAGSTWTHEDSQKSPRHLVQQEEPVGVGRTTIVSPFLGCVARLDGPEEGMLYASMDLRILKDIRSVYKIRQDLHSQSTTKARSSS